MTDIITVLSAIDPDGALARTRIQRSAAVANSQLSFEALLEPLNPGTFSFGERYAVATYVAGLHQDQAAFDFYGELLLDDAPASLRDAVAAAVQQGLASGPYGTYREVGLAAESQPGPSVRHDAAALGERLAAAFDVAHLMVLHPRDSRPEVLGHLSGAGWSADELVSLAQLVAFLAYQLRVVHGLRVVDGREATVGPTPSSGSVEQVDWQLSDRGFPVTTYPDIVAPERFVSHSLGWKPWAPPVPKGDLRPDQWEALVEKRRADMPYFRLLARDPQALKARTLTDNDIFYNIEGGLGRAERELSAAATSRLNGCTFCASVHAGFAIEQSGRVDDVERLLAEGVGADLGSESWNAVVDAAVALTHTPVRFGSAQVDRLRAAGLDDAAVLDVINSAAFFNWANRLMLGLGEPEVPARLRA
ncbi:alkylhydroperoxidase domain protein [Propionibacteriaceae bacterium Y1923]